MAIRFLTSGWRAVVADEFSSVQVGSEPCEPGLSAGGDPDRFEILEADGSFATPKQSMALFFDYLVEYRKWTGGAARSVALSHLVGRVADAPGLPGYETPVGFKHLGELTNENKIVIGGEESAGLSIKGHYQEKDGIFACLLAAEAVASCGASLVERLKQQYLEECESAGLGGAS